MAGARPSKRGGLAAWLVKSVNDVGLGPDRKTEFRPDISTMSGAREQSKFVRVRAPLDAPTANASRANIMDLKLVASSRKEVIGGVHYTLLIPYNEPATYTSDRRSEPVEADFSAPSDPFRRFDWAPTDPWPKESISDRVGKQNEHSKAVGLSQKPEPPAFCRISDVPS